MNGFFKTICLLLALFSAPGAGAAEPTPDDPFRYLEDAADPRTQAFFKEQGEKARAYLDRIPGRAQMLDRIHALSQGETFVGEVKLSATRVFYMKLHPRAPTAMLCYREGVAGAEKVLLDPRRYDEGARPAAIDWFAPSPDGRHVAFGVSTGGSGNSMLRVIAVDGAKVLPQQIDRTRFNDDLAWHPDGRSFFYARTPEGNPPARRDANIRMYRHVLGRDTASDEIVFASGAGGARDVPEMAYPSIHVPLESRHAYAIVREGLRQEVAVHTALLADLAGGKPRWHKLAGHEDEVLAVEGWRDDLFVLSRHNASHHRLLRVKAAAQNLIGARSVVAHPDVVLVAFGVARDAIYLKTMVGGVHRLERLPLGLLGSGPPEFVRTPFDHSITQLVTSPRQAGALLLLQGWIDAPTVVQIDTAGNLKRTTIVPQPLADYSEMDEVRLYVPLADGAKVPVTLIYRKSTRLDGNNPTILTAYGSYGVTLTPNFDPGRLAWLERGGVFAVAHVRGGGEYGEAWRAAAHGTRKVNAVMDTIAVAEFLVSYGFTNPRRLALLGTGAGGVPIGGALVRRPDLFAAAVARTPMMDMLRYELSGEGQANVPEFGSAATAQGSEALRAISAYHQVKDGVPYPAMMLTAGMNDPRIDAWQPGKMAARLQAATPGHKPVLLRLQADAGHGRGVTRTQREAELADTYAFLFSQLEDPAFALP